MKIAVVGAGIAGLRSAQLLEKQGHAVTVYEAADRIGGRLMTIRQGEGWVEGGGEWLDADHTRCFELMRELGIAPERSQQWPGLVVCQGDFATENQVWPDAEADSNFVHEQAVELINRGGAPDIPLGAWLDEQCVSARGRWWVEAVTRSDEGEDTVRIGLLGWLQGYAQYLDREPGDMSLFRFSHPTQQVCQRLAESLKNPVQLNTLISVITENGELKVNGNQVLFDRIVCAVPPSQFEKLGIGPSPCGMARAIKVVLLFSRPWWTEKLWSGRMICDLPCQQTWSGGRDGLHALSCYVCGEDSVWLAERSDPIETALRALTEIHPEAQETFESGMLIDWASMPNIEGAFPSIRPGDLTGWQAARNPRGKLHFAGDWATDQIGFIEGALGSAERVAKEIGS